MLPVPRPLSALLLLCLQVGCAMVTDDGKASRFSLPFARRNVVEPVSPEFREARRMFGKNTEKNLLAWALYQEDQEQYAEAMKTYRDLSIAYPESVHPQLGIARIEAATGRSEQALSVLQKAAVAHPQDVDVQLQLMSLHSSAEDWEQCLQVCEKVCQLAPNDQNARYQVGISMVRAGRIQDALSHLTFSVGRPAACYNVAWILHEQSRNADAIQWLQQALSEHPDRQTAERSRALLAELSGNAREPRGGGSEMAVSGESSSVVVQASAAADQGRVIRAGGPVEAPAWNGPATGTVRPARHSGPAAPAGPRLQP